jgi:hypothetical protein
VYVGNTTNTGGGMTSDITWQPENPSADQIITITVTGATQGAKLHWGVNINGSTWQSADQAYWPAGTTLFNGVGPAVESIMTGPDTQGKLTIQLGPFNNASQLPQGIDFVLHYNDNTWNNNNSQDYHIPISPEAGIDENNHPIITLYPNPVIDVCFVHNLSEINHTKILLTSITGQILKEYTLTNKKARLDLKDLQKGIYLLKFRNDGGNTIATKLLKL